MEITDNIKLINAKTNKNNLLNLMLMLPDNNNLRGTFLIFNLIMYEKKTI